MKILTQCNYKIVSHNRPAYPVFAGRLSVFSKKMDKMLNSTNTTQRENLNLLNLLKKMLHKSAKSKSVLGEGRRGVVLSLDSKYVLKLDKNDPTKLDFMNIPSDRFRNLNFKSYFGGIVAKFGNVQVLKNVSKTGNHFPAGVPVSFVKNNLNKECINYYEEIYLPRFASLPQKSFDDVAYDFNLLNKNSGEGHCFDVRNPNNFVLVGRKIRIVDSICKSFDDEMTTTELLAPFLFFRDISSECFYSAKALANRRKIFNKLILAGLKNDLPLMNNSSAYIMEEVLENLCKSKVDTKCFVNDMLQLKAVSSNKKELLSLAKRYLNSIFDSSNSVML